MKYSLLVSALVLTSTIALNGTSKLMDAIEAQNVDEVKHLAKHHEPLTLEQKAKYLATAHEIARECKEKTESLFRSGYDLLKVGVGGIVGVSATLGALANFGIGLAVDSLYKNNPEFRRELHKKGLDNPEDIKLVKRTLFLWSGANAVIAGLSWWLFSKGWSMNSAHSALEKARKIEKHIEEMPVL